MVPLFHRKKIVLFLFHYFSSARKTSIYIFLIYKQDVQLFKNFAFKKGSQIIYY